MQCPKCESDDVLLCSTAYEQGKTVIETRGESEGGDSNGRFTASYESTHTALTEFAKRAAAPEAKTSQPIYALITAVVAYFVVPSVWHDFTGHTPQWLSFLLLAGIAVTLYHLIAVYKKYRQEDSARQTTWERSWICKRCGTIFEPQEQVAGIASDK